MGPSDDFFLLGTIRSEGVDGHEESEEYDGWACTLTKAKH